jgi:hypothetical protein
MREIPAKWASETPQGRLVGVVDEYGTVWAGEPGESKRIGDLVVRDDEETSWLYVEEESRWDKMFALLRREIRV